MLNSTRDQLNRNENYEALISELTIATTLDDYCEVLKTFYQNAVTYEPTGIKEREHLTFVYNKLDSFFKGLKTT